MPDLDGGPGPDYEVRLSARGFDVHDRTIAGEIVFTSHSRPAARLVAEALGCGRLTRDQVVRWPTLSLAEVRKWLEEES